MTKTHLLYLRDQSPELEQLISSSGPILCLPVPPVYLVRPEIPGAQTHQLLSPENHAALNELLAVSCEYDPATANLLPAEVDRYLNIVTTGLQLVQPTRGFCEYQLQFDSNRRIISLSTATQFVAAEQLNPFLAYQQHNTILPDDMWRAIKLIPQVSQALERYSSWTHPCGSIHRALVFFCQGYTVDFHVLISSTQGSALNSMGLE